MRKKIIWRFQTKEGRWVRIPPAPEKIIAASCGWRLWKGNRAKAIAALALEGRLPGFPGN